MILNIVHELAGHLSQLCGRHILTHRMHVGQSRGHISRRKLIVQFIGVTEMGEAQRSLRAMRTKARDGFIRALGNARRWLDELLIDPAQTIESLALREDKSERSIRMTVSLAFISPILAEAALEGRLPRGFSVKRLTDLPVLWSERWRAVGLREPIQIRAELG